MPTKTWVVGEEVLAADFNSYVQKQVVSTFANAAARDAAIPAPTAGMMCYLITPPALQVYGTAWQPLPAGLLATTEYAVDSGQVSNTPVPSGVVVNVTLPAGRRIRIAASLGMRGTVQTHHRAAIYQDGAQSAFTAGYGADPNAMVNMHMDRIITPAAGAHEYRIYVWTDVGSAVICASACLTTLTVEDVGAV